MDENELYQIVFGFFGYKCRMQNFDPEKMEVTCILYDTFLLKCNLNGRNNRYSCEISLGNNAVTITEFLGNHCFLNNDLESIKGSLGIVDDYCRLRLPDKFIEAYFQAYSTNQFSV